MTQAPFILCAFWCASSPTLGAIPVAPGEASLSLSAGLNGLLPTVGVSARAGLVPDLDVGFRYDTHAGLAHDVGVLVRGAFAERWALELDASHVFYAIEELGGISAVDSPFGNGAATTLSLMRSEFSDGGAHIVFGAGFTVRWLELQSELGTVTREMAPSLQQGHFEIAAEWEGDGGTTFLRFRGVVPIQADFRVLGYLPWVSIGTTWGLP